jgi:methylmalonyl-CoA mutase N-terminal domain/subunit|tara:strand:- start:1176 stop:2678 length:1503 start_codon:yes stop_codon:yes gene_type:complete
MGDPNPPGLPPYSNGIYKEMYKKKIWTMRQYAGFSTAKETNIRFKELLNKGQTGLSVAFDLPTQLGLDSDDDMSLGEVGKVGVPIDSINDMRELFKDIDLSKVSTSMTINAPATTLLALYVALADENSIPRSDLTGTVQNDILKEYIARGLYVYPPKHSMRLTTDLMEWCQNNAPKWNTVSVSGYHLREAGCTASEELAFSLSNASYYVNSAIERGLNIDDFAPRISFFFGCHNNFVEEICKFRAARIMWYEMMKKHNPKNPKSSMLRFHTQTAGVTLTAQQPMVNTIRVAYQALAAVLGGTQSLHTNSYDEAIGLPTQDAVTIALRTQQVIASETSIIDYPDLFSGSILIEKLTSELISEANKIVDTIEKNGGAMKCISAGIQQRMIHESAWNHLESVESGSTKVVGVNEHIMEEEDPIEALMIDEDSSIRQLNSLKKYKNNRDMNDINFSLENLKSVCMTNENIMESLISAIKAGSTVGEVNAVMIEVFGTWIAPSGV